MMRHADSEERLQSVRDHDRPITEAGKMCAREVGCQTSMSMVERIAPCYRPS